MLQILFSLTPPALLFDLDGTLVDSAPDIAVAIGRCLNEEGREPLPLPEVAGLIGAGARNLVKGAFELRGGLPESDDEEKALDRLLTRFRQFYVEAPAALTRPYPGVEETLAAFAEVGCPMAVVTNKPQESTDALLRDLGLDHFFAVAIGAGSAAHLKPHPAPLWTALNSLESSWDGLPGGNRQVVMIGDSENDVAAARAANMPVVAVSFGYRHCPVDQLGADAVVDGFAELPEAIARVLAAAREGHVDSADLGTLYNGFPDG